MKKTTLVIMAAGLGSRYAPGRIKQLEPVGPNGEIIMDYSVYDAARAGFDKIVFIIRKDIKKAFDEMIGDRLAKRFDTDYVFQETDDLPEKYSSLIRPKPWGTAHAVLACRGKVSEPFAVINADDAYGRQTFEKMHEFLVSDSVGGNKLHLAMPGFILSNTLSESGTVTRAVCRTDENSMLSSITETYGIGYREGRLTALTAKGAETTKEIDPAERVSMNMWGCPAEFIDTLKGRFEEFLKVYGSDKDAEFLLPTVIGDMIDKNQADCRLYETDAKWFGMTSAQDRQAAQNALRLEIENGVYPQSLI